MDLYGSEDVNNKQVNATDDEREYEEEQEYINTPDSSDITDVDATPPRVMDLHMSSIISDLEEEEETTVKPPHQLLSILTGNQKKRKVLKEEITQPKPETLEDLEKKMYSKIKSTSIKDLFTSYNKKEFNSNITIKISSEKLKNIRPTPPSEKKQPPLVKKPVIDHESKIFENAKRTTARDLFNNFKPKVTELLQPGITTYPVIIKLNPNQLAKFNLNPLRTKGNNVNGTSCKSVFAEMMTASKNNKLRTTTQIKEMKLPPLSKDQFHVLDEFISYIPPLPKKLHVQPEEFSGIVPPPNIPKSKSKYSYTNYTVNKKEFALNKIPILHKAPQLQAIFNKLDQQQPEPKLPWVNKYQPEQMSELVMHKHNLKHIKNWIENSFLKLKSQAPVKDLNRKLKKRKLDSFILDDEETEDEIYSPFLILQGSCGSGKSTAVFTAMHQLKGYVHEINTGNARSRKDIHNSLKELCTTQLVNDTKEFQKGLVLFEDVNILFEQDKTFWQVVQDIINVSKRPIILTCEELWNIPKNLIQFAQDDDSIIFIDDYPVSKKLVADYMWLCCLNEDYDVDDHIIDEIIDENWNGHNYDLRGCLNQCEMLCKIDHLPEQVVKITKIVDMKVDESENLEVQAQQYDLNSASDVISSCSKSQILSDIQDNEFIDLYYIDDISRKKSTQFYEFNCGEEIKSLLNLTITDQPQPKFMLTDLMYECQNFIGSRSKKFSKFFYQHIDHSRATRSSSDLSNPYNEPTTGLPETSFLYNISPAPFVLDLLPFTRSWQIFQNEIDKYELQNLKDGNASVKKFLQYRDFQHKSSLIATIPDVTKMNSYNEVGHNPQIGLNE
ncbi:hypothetical protein KGF54_000265 [Candida jiufengensis]|uniref:uncharacterized protein n=1 Tax=Candida jiufengensis TaxID=497108 RepID=UPI002224A8B9|nr:uncharacterized protein KGF54_000265 [Candida jiufengensis]KAI5957337.1 hypothetical protein KGF54_000265 [Candida jiufengensis]